MRVFRRMGDQARAKTGDDLMSEATALKGFHKSAEAASYGSSSVSQYK
jgi:hypothetical protein